LAARDGPAIRLARPPDAAGIAKVETETWRDAYPTLLPEAYLVRNFGAASRWPERLRGYAENVLVAEAETNEIVAYATWGPARRQWVAPGDPPAAQIFELYVQQDYRDQGLGRRFCSTIANRVAGRGIRALYVEVLEGNPNRFFYETMGATLAARTQRDFAGERLATAVYVWTNLKALSESEVD